MKLSFNVVSKISVVSVVSVATGEIIFYLVYKIGGVGVVTGEIIIFM